MDGLIKTISVHATLINVESIVYQLHFVKPKARRITIHLCAPLVCGYLRRSSSSQGKVGQQQPGEEQPIAQATSPGITNSRISQGHQTHNEGEEGDDQDEDKQSWNEEDGQQQARNDKESLPQPPA